MKTKRMLQDQFNKLERFIPKAEREALLLIAGLVWLAAGVNIVRMGTLGLISATFFLPLIIAGAAAVFLLFFLLIFRKLVGKHTKRILAYEEKKIAFLRFFDGKSYLIMAFMMTFGILLRTSGLLPGECIGSIYIGLGAALMAAGLGFMNQYVRTFRTSVER